MKKILLFILPLVILSSCSTPLNPNDAAELVMIGEKENLPLLIQRLNRVDSITIDSVRIHTTVEPMDAFMYTTWYMSGKRLKNLRYESFTEVKPIIVKVDSIRRSKTHEGYVEWQAKWSQAYSDATDW